MAKKGGKKKKPAKISVQAYNLETISKEDLKKYIASLEKELALMRKDRAFHSANKDRVMEFLYAKRDSLLSLKQKSVVKNTIVDDHFERLRTHPKKKNESTVIDDREEIRKLMEKSFEDFVSVKCAEMDHIDKEHTLKQSIANQHKRLECDEFLYAMTLMDANQRTQNVVGDLELKHCKTIENMLSEDIDEVLRLNQEFSSDKIKALTSIWDSDDPVTTESFVCEIKRMQDFFHEIAFNSGEVIKMLRDKLTNLTRESNMVEMNLKLIWAENTKLRCSSQPDGLMQTKRTAPFSPVLYSKKNFESEKKFIALQYQNDILARYLHMIDGNLKALKKQFTNALRKVCQRANFKTLLIEDQILSLLRNESPEPDNNVKPDVRRELPEKEAKIKDTLNVVNLNFENADTLFVPPVYHEFWNSRIKYCKN